jgi:hypothetical protein
MPTRWRPAQSEHSAARCHLDCGDPPAVEHHQPVAVSGTEQTRIVRKRRDDMLDQLLFADEIRILIRDIHPVATDETYAQHRSRHDSDARRFPAHGGGWTSEQGLSVGGR